MLIKNNQETKKERSSLEDKKYRLLYETSQDAIMTLEPPTWAFAAGNSAAIKLFGATSEAEFISFTPDKISPEKQPDGQLSSIKAKKMIKQALREGSNYFEWTHKKLNGESFPTTVLLTKIFTKEKTYLQATVRDITKEKEAEEKIKKSEKRFSDLVNSSSDWIWEIDNDGKYTYVSEGVEKLLGYKSKEVIGKTPFDFMENSEAERIKKILKEVISKQQPIKDLENLNLTKTGEKVYFLTNGVPILDNDKNIIGYRGVDKNISKEKEVEEAKKKQILELERLNRLMVGRELKMIELKKELEILKAKSKSNNV